MITIIGAGNMAYEYCRVLNHFGKNVEVIGRGQKKCDELRKLLDAEGIVYQIKSGGIDKYNRIHDTVIIAVNVENLYDCAMNAIRRGAKRILIEKPGTLYSAQMENLKRYAEKYRVKIKIAYNRRYYETVKELKKRMYEEGVEKLAFCYGENLKSVKTKDEVRKRWIIANSSHCIDTALYLAEKNTVRIITAGETMCGREGKLFYSTNYNLHHRWRIEVTTPQNKYLLYPFEELKKNNETILTEPNNFKCGLVAMMKDYLSGHDNLPNAEEQYHRLRLYERMGGL